MCAACEVETGVVPGQKEISDATARLYDKAHKVMAEHTALDERVPRASEQRLLGVENGYWRSCELH